MATRTNVERSAAGAAHDLAAHLDPARIVVDGPELGAASAVWNGAVDHHPALVVRCASTGDVQAAVRAARRHGLPLSVRGGGHDWAGRAIRPGALVVDLTSMRQVDVHDRTATAAGGATSADVAEAADRHGLAAVADVVGVVGVAGLSLGGGYAPLTGRFGLAADNVLWAEVVLADGRVVDTVDEPDLLWALRGGGGNFGVVTAMQIGLHPVRSVLTGSILFPWSDAASVIGGYAELVGRSPDELVAGLTIMSTPDGAPAVAVGPTWSGPPADGPAVLQQFLSLGTPLHAETATKSPLDVLRRFDGAFPDGQHYAIRTRSLPALFPDVVTTLLDATETRPSPTSFLNLHHLHGAAARVPPESTAFGLRRDHFMVEIIAMWAPGPGAAQRAWTDRVSTALAPHALPGGYPNLLGADDVEQTAYAYGPNAARLRAVKTRFDPRGVFVATPLPGPTPRS